VSASDDELLQRPIFIVGAPRSGTAVLAEVLRADPDLAYVREPRLVWRYGNDARSDLLEADDARPEVVAHIRASFAREVRDQGKRRLLEKTPSNSLRLPFVDRIFPDATFVHIVRDGADTVAAIRRRWLEPPRDLRVPRQRDRLRRHLREASWRQYPHYARELVQKVTPRSLATVIGDRPWGPRLPGLDGLRRDLDLLDVCALQWRLCVERAAHHGRRLPPGRYMECRVDTFDAATVERIARFCDLTHVDEVLAAFDRAFDADRVVQRSKELSDDELDRVMTWIEPTLAWLAATSPSPAPGTTG
jgi:hypothetical protein